MSNNINFKQFFLQIRVNTATFLDEIWRMDKSGKESAISVAKIPDGATDLTIFSNFKMDKSNHCVHNNGGCSHLCLAVPSQTGVSFTCACPTHYVLIENNTCIGM